LGWQPRIPPNWIVLLTADGHGTAEIMGTTPHQNNAPRQIFGIVIGIHVADDIRRRRAMVLGDLRQFSECRGLARIDPLEVDALDVDRVGAGV